MTDIVKGMARCFEIASDKGTYDEEAMRGALLWLAANVTDGMIDAAQMVIWTTSDDTPMDETRRAMIAAAIRAAAGGEG